MTRDDGTFTLHVPVEANVSLTAYHRGDQTVTVHAGFVAKAPAIDLPAVGSIDVAALENGSPVPVRIQVLPVAPTVLPSVPENYGEEAVTAGRLHVIYAMEGFATMLVPPGDADPGNRVIRYHAQIPIQVAATGGYVIVAASGTRALDPVHPGKRPFGVTNPIVVVP